MATKKNGKGKAKATRTVPRNINDTWGMLKRGANAHVTTKTKGGHTYKGTSHEPTK